MDRLGPAGEYTTLPVALQPSDVALQGSFTIYLGANRGRGQAYPNGAASNLVSYRWDEYVDMSSVPLPA